MLILNKKKWFKKKLYDMNASACTSICLVGTTKDLLRYEVRLEDSSVRLSKQTYDYILDCLKQSNEAQKEMIEIIKNLKGEL